MTDRTCPLGDDCDLTTAWMAGAMDARRKMEADRDAAIAAAYEAAVQRVESIHAYAMSPSARLGFTATKDEAVERIRALTPAEAIAARDADRARVRREALEEALRETAIMPVSLPANPRMAFEAALEAVEHRIRAIIEEEGNE